MKISEFQKLNYKFIQPPFELYKYKEYFMLKLEDAEFKSYNFYRSNSRFYNFTQYKKGVEHILESLKNKIRRK